nr:MAG TPA: hypothetical protein [Caudoviricetes sp.]
MINLQILFSARLLLFWDLKITHSYGVYYMIE